MQCFILAGGFATRLWPLTEKRAKPLLPLAGKPLLTHLLERIPKGLPVTVSTNAVFAQDFEEWKSHVSRLTSMAPEASAKNAHVSIIIEDSDHEDRKLGALGAVSKWITEHGIDDDVLLLAGDNYLGFDLQNLIDAFDGTPLLAAHDIGDPEKAKHFGTVIVDEMTNVQCPIRSDSISDIKTEPQPQPVLTFEEKPPHPKSTLISTGATIIPKQYLPLLVIYAKDHPDNIGGIFEHFLENKIPVVCMAFAEPWFDIGSFAAYLEATKALIGDNILKGPEVIDERNTFEGSVVLGEQSEIRNSRLTNVVTFGHCVILDCEITDCIVDTACTLQGIDLSGKMLRSGTKLIRKP